MSGHIANDEDRKCSKVTTADTPITVHRHKIIRDAQTAAEHLLNAVRNYNAVCGDGFPMSGLARIEANLEKATNAVFDMTASERTAHIETGVAAAEDERLRVAAAWPVRPVGFRPEPTLSASAVLRSVSEGDED